ncbi:hypothetical protein A2714_02935 [Candidatus Woesebacteria bacterium RIFCSPHIGHO2_01_FULL_38_9]|uniref:Uncharacterized protein n=2 Tax=Candidatus Woeseibacteriota TaxID=1752722 RepID=A0A1F7Y108_9BACT|nr:MAG: hypothetical protein A2714_02935 [Candidatus Woesebacteria bacterium RIFCSPHIGHO2_01_FULL_38_9]OGM58188.1 MAG: hypothetical protein A3A75_03815 [Candidatus Woesebacteria bacterium RIFCSPLOWO2_01_FULL_39_10]
MTNQKITTELPIRIKEEAKSEARIITGLRLEARTESFNLKTNKENLSEMNFIIRRRPLDRVETRVNKERKTVFVKLKEFEKNRPETFLVLDAKITPLLRNFFQGNKIFVLLAVLNNFLDRLVSGEERDVIVLRILPKIHPVI